MVAGMSGDTFVVEATDVVADHGSMVTFEGIAEIGGKLVTARFAADHREAQIIVDYIAAHGQCRCTIAGWQLLSTSPA